MWDGLISAPRPALRVATWIGLALLGSCSWPRRGVTRSPSVTDEESASPRRPRATLVAEFRPAGSNSARPTRTARRARRATRSGPAARSATAAKRAARRPAAPMDGPAAATGAALRACVLPPGTAPTTEPVAHRRRVRGRCREDATGTAASRSAAAGTPTARARTASTPAARRSRGAASNRAG